MICIEPIACANVERVAYIIYQDKHRGIHKCIGHFIEQENDAGECQFLFVMDWNSLTEEDLDYVVVPGIDLEQHREVYVRSYEIPYFVECCTVPDGRGDLKRWLHRMGMDYNDKFEFMLRSRAITHHSNCYLGRTPTDFCDAVRVMSDIEYSRRILPNLAETPENIFHPIIKEAIS